MCIRDRLPRMALLSSAVMLLGLAAINPDAWIARHNLERYEQTSKIDWDYFRDLSADAVPTLAASPADVRACALAHVAITGDDDWLGWNYGRARAESVGHGLTAGSSAGCDSTN